MLMPLFTKLPLLNFSRMVRPRGRSRGANANAPPPPPYIAAMMQQFELNRQLNESLVNRLERNDARQEPGPISLREFVRLNPVTSGSSSNPLDADDWLRDITFQMESADVALASYVTFAAYHLRGSAAQWWESHRRMLPDGTVTTWEEFQTAFRARYIPRGLMDQKKKEFRNLIQGKMTVDEYQRKFLELSRYAEDDVSTDAHKQEKFQDGLNPRLKLALCLHDFVDFATLASKTFQAETGQAELQESLKRTQDISSSSGQPAQKRRVWIPYNVYHQPAPAPRPSYVTPRVPPPPRQLRTQGGQPNNMAHRPTRKACHKCGQSGHFTKFCSQNQNVRPSAVELGHANHVKTEETQKAPTIVMGTLLVNSVPASVLFDSGASHSFVSRQFVQLHELRLDSLPTPLEVQSPGSRCQTKMVSHNNQITIAGLVFPTSLIVLGSSNIDVILGMD